MIDDEEEADFDEEDDEEDEEEEDEEENLIGNSKADQVIRSLFYAMLRCVY
jgi:hypothetical protein